MCVDGKIVVGADSRRAAVLTDSRSDERMSDSRRPGVLAVTGGIGSGKSLVCRMFLSRGVPVYDSDSRTKALYTSIPGLTGRISDELGVDLELPDGGMDFKVLASLVFGDREKLQKLEDIIYPEVKKDFLEWACSQSDVPIVIMESAVILEKPFFHDILDCILLVDAPLELRQRRAAERNRCSLEQVASRMANQKLLNEISLGVRASGADFVIWNDGGMEELEAGFERVYSEIFSGFAGISDISEPAGSLDQPLGKNGLITV